MVIAIARDGYRAAFFWPELVNTDSGAQVMVAFERDGSALAADEGPLVRTKTRWCRRRAAGADEGPLVLMAPADQRPGPRRVKWLQRIEVRILRD